MALSCLGCSAVSAVDNLTQKMCSKWDRSGLWRLFQQVIPVPWQAWLLKRRETFCIGWRGYFYFFLDAFAENMNSLLLPLLSFLSMGRQMNAEICSVAAKSLL